MAWIETPHANAADLADACATRIAALSASALEERGHAVLALAGGRTSPPLFRRLAAMPLRWADVTVVPTDERWVAYSHEHCNLRQLRDAFAGAQGLRSIALVPEQPSGAPDAGFAAAALAAVPAPFDAVLLGMGEDGHFASLFAGAPGVATALDPGCVDEAIAVVPEPLPANAPHARISLTLPRLLRSRMVLLAVTGGAKRDTLLRAQEQPDRFPVGALLRAGAAQVEIHWSP